METILPRKGTDSQNKKHLDSFNKRLLESKKFSCPIYQRDIFLPVTERNRKKSK
jgi:hypothetical protein